jgi:hypothetical protein
MTVIGGGWQAGDGWYELYSAARVASATYGLGTTFADNPGEQLEIWTQIAIRGDRDHTLCCDRACPRFGEVAEGEDYHPWMNGSAPLITRGKTFFEFLSLSSGEPT